MMETTTDKEYLDSKRAQSKHPDRWSAEGSADRNKEPLWQAFRNFLTKRQGPAAEDDLDVLEIASGTGQQLTHIVKELQLETAKVGGPLHGLKVWFTPSEVDRHLQEVLERAFSNVGQSPLINVERPVVIDLDASDWHLRELSNPPDVIFAFNLVHIAPWSVAESLFSGAAALFEKNPRQRGHLILYGAYKTGQAFQSEGDKRFDEILKSRNPAYGLRDIGAEMVPLAVRCGFSLSNLRPMPAGNLWLEFAWAPKSP